MRRVSSREVYRNPWIPVREDAVELADGSAGVYGVVERPHVAWCRPTRTTGSWLVEQFRYPLGRRSREHPQGTWPAGREGTAEDLARAEPAWAAGRGPGRPAHRRPSLAAYSLWLPARR